MLPDGCVTAGPELLVCASIRRCITVRKSGTLSSAGGAVGSYAAAAFCDVAALSCGHEAEALRCGRGAEALRCGREADVLPRGLEVFRCVREAGVSCCAVLCDGSSAPEPLDPVADTRETRRRVRSVPSGVPATWIDDSLDVLEAAVRVAEARRVRPLRPLKRTYCWLEVLAEVAADSGLFSGSGEVVPPDDVSESCTS